MTKTKTTAETHKTDAAAALALLDEAFAYFDPAWRQPAPAPANDNAAPAATPEYHRNA